MSRYLTVLLAALVIASAFGCEKSKLRDDMMGDSTWESSTGEEKWEAADQPPKRNDEWEEETNPTREFLLVSSPGASSCRFSMKAWVASCRTSRRNHHSTRVPSSVFAS
jgi:hypothetical protein